MVPTAQTENLAGALPLLLALGASRQRLGVCGGAPLIDLTLFRERAFTVGIICVLVVEGVVR